MEFHTPNSHNEIGRIIARKSYAREWMFTFSHETDLRSIKINESSHFVVVKNKKKRIEKKKWDLVGWWSSNIAQKIVSKTSLTYTLHLIRQPNISPSWSNHKYQIAPEQTLAIVWRGGVIIVTTLGKTSWKKQFLQKSKWIIICFTGVFTWPWKKIFREVDLSKVCQSKSVLY